MSDNLTAVSKHSSIEKFAMNPKSKCALVLALFFATTLSLDAVAQMPAPGPEIDILKKDVGEWDVEIKAWAQPGAKPAISKGSESTRLFGGFWTITNFEGNMMGLDFKGHGTYGYDTKKKKYVGTWMDSLGPYMMHTEGDYDEETKTITMVGDSPAPDGVSTITNTISTCYKDGKRVMTLHMQPKGSAEDQKVKLFEMTYTKKETKEAMKK